MMGTDGRLLSIIIPVYNAAPTVAPLVDRLLEATNSLDAEIIVVDNNSTDDVQHILDSVPIRVIQEKKQGSYAARNAGARIALGDWLLFIDADGMPHRDCIRRLLHAQKATNADIAAAAVSFTHSEKPSRYEYYDSLANLQVKDLVSRRQVALTVCLMVRRTCYKSVGGFEQGVASGADILFVARAVDLGFRLEYAEEAIIEHPARDRKELLAKHRRTSLGKRALARYATTPTIKARLRSRSLFSRCFPLWLWRNANRQYPSLGWGGKAALIWVHYEVLLVSLFVRIRPGSGR